LFKTAAPRAAQTRLMTDQTFTPALGRLAPARFFDRVIALTRDRMWRALVAAYVAPQPGDVIVDVGCGTGTTALLLSRVAPDATVIGIDPDPEVLAVARSKAGAADSGVQWRLGMGDGLADSVGSGRADTMTSSMVLHQCPVAMKRAVLASMFDALRPGGTLVLADFGLQRTWLMRLAFRLVQWADGASDTQPNADGVLPQLISEAGFSGVREVEVIPTVNGSISIYVARKLPTQ
jgi:ubiquinone/menaquinone biosynthesis C-methylase UbiE